MAGQDLQPLFATPENDESQWFLPVETKFGPIELPIIRRQIIQELQDQAEIRASQRKAILRATHKAVIRAHKTKLSNFSEQEFEKYKWNLFILRVDEAIQGRHEQIRKNADFAETIVDEGHFVADKISQ